MPRRIKYFKLSLAGSKGNNSDKRTIKNLNEPQIWIKIFGVHYKIRDFSYHLLLKVYLLKLSLTALPLQLCGAFKPIIQASVAAVS